MKKAIMPLLMVLAVAFTFTSCKKDKDKKATSGNCVQIIEDSAVEVQTKLILFGSEPNKENCNAAKTSLKKLVNALENCSKGDIDANQYSDIIDEINDLDCNDLPN